MMGRENILADFVSDDKLDVIEYCSVIFIDVFENSDLLLQQRKDENLKLLRACKVIKKYTEGI